MPDSHKSSLARLQRLDYLLMAGLFAGSILLRVLFLLPTRFDGLYGQDAYAYYDFAQELRSAFSEGRAPGDFFWPLGYPALLALQQAFLNTSPQTAQAANILMGAALAPLLYTLTFRMEGSRIAGFSAGVLMSICGQALQSSLVIMADIPALFWAVASAVFLWLYIRTGRLYALFLAALPLALASITRWLYLILFIPWLLTLLIVWRGRVRWRETAVGAVAVLLIFLPQFAYSRANPAPVLNHAWVEGWSPANALRVTFENLDGHFEYAAPNLSFYAQPFYESYYFAPIFTPLLLLGIWHLYRRQQRATLTFLLLWGLLPYLFLVGIPYQNIRFQLILFPAVAVLAGFGLARAWEWLGQRAKPALWRLGLMGLFVFGAALTVNTAWQTISLFLTNQQRDKDTAAWAAANIPPDETLYTFGLTLTLKHYTSLNAYDIYYETPDTLSQKWIRGQDDYLLLNMWSIRNQWVGLAPETAYNWLAETRGLTRLGTFDYYTLFRVEG